MGIYSSRDIYSTTSGDIIIGANGDLKIANSIESVSGAVNFILRTDRGEYTPDKRVGADLGSFIGRTMSPSLISDMEANIRQNLTKFVLAANDLQEHVVPLSEEEVGVIVGYGGQYIDKDGNVMDTTIGTLNYVFPYIEGSPEPI